MNSILTKLLKNRFLLFIPFLLFFSFSFSYLIRTIIIVFLNPPISQFIERKNKNTNNSSNSTSPLQTYELMVEGSLIRGKLFVAEKAGSSDVSMMSSGNKSNSVSLAMSEDKENDDVYIIGTISGHSSFALAILEEKKGKDSEEYSIGQSINGYKVKQIDPHAVIFEKSGIAIRVEIGETISEAKKRFLEEAPPDAEILSSETVKKILSREDVNSKLKNPTELYKGAAFGPNIVNGKMDGFKITSVAPGHIFYSLGARNSDIIKRVNGMPLQDTEKSFEIWNSVKNAQKITIDVDRKGKIITYEFTIRN